jgi:ubiquinone/menaquinone biosynthesis C-methylase UbiE
MVNDAQLNNLQKTFEDVSLYEEWDRRYYYPEAVRFYRLAFDFIVKALGVKPGDVVLDAGCGPAKHTMEFARQGIFCRAVDFSEAVLKEAERRATAAALDRMIQFQKEDLTELTFPDRTFDFIFCWGVLMHVPDIRKAVSELARVLKPGGRIAVTLTNPKSAEMMAYRTLRRILKGKRGEESPWLESPTGPIYVRGIPPDELIQMLSSNHVRLIEARPGQFAEFRPKNWLLRKVISLWNEVWFKAVRFPSLASGYIIIGEKERS